jgi:hypothetical protein
VSAGVQITVWKAPLYPIIVFVIIVFTTIINHGKIPYLFLKQGNRYNHHKISLFSTQLIVPNKYQMLTDHLVGILTHHYCYMFFLLLPLISDYLQFYWWEITYIFWCFWIIWFGHFLSTRYNTTVKLPSPSIASTHFHFQIKVLTRKNLLILVIGIIFYSSFIINITF